MAKTNGSTQSQTNAFSPFPDFTKFMPTSPMAAFDLSAMTEAQRRNTEAFTQASQRTMEAMQTLMRRQSEMMREGWQETASLFGEMVSAGTPEEKVACQTAMAKTTMEKCVSNSREIAEMVTRTNMDAVEALSQCLTSCMESMGAAYTRK